MKYAIGRWWSTTAVLLAAFLSVAAGPSTSTVKPEDLLQAGAAARLRLAGTGARWTSIIAAPQATAAIIVRWTASSAGSRAEISVQANGGASQPLATIIARDNTWFVIEGGRHVNCQPFAYPFSYPPVTGFYLMSAAQATDGIAPGGSVAGAIDVDHVLYRVPLSVVQRSQIQGVLDQYDAHVKSDPAGMAKLDRTTLENMDSLRSLLTSGNNIVVDARDGIVTQRSAARVQVSVPAFEWLDQPDPTAVDVAGTTWEDRTAGPAGVADPTDLVLMAVDPSFAPGQAKMTNDPDCSVVDVRTGAAWRVPFIGTTVTGGSFVPTDRMTVVVSASDSEGGVGLYRIDLRTGENRRLGGAALADGMTLFPAVSPDGRTVVVMRMEMTGAPTQTRFILVDLASGTVTPLGQPDDYGPPSWLPDGSGIVTVRRRMVAGNDYPVNTLVRMDRAGTVTPLRSGSDPLVLPGQNRILFADGATGRDLGPWTTCDLAGGEPRLLGDGLREYGFPAVSPDGKRLMLIHLQRPERPRSMPFIFDLPALTSHPMPIGAGLWTLPKW